MIFGTQSIEQRNLLRLRYDLAIYGLSFDDLDSEIIQWLQDYARCQDTEIDTLCFIKDRIQNIIDCMKKRGFDPKNSKGYIQYTSTGWY